KPLKAPAARSIAYSTVASPTPGAVRAFIKQYGPGPKAIATGGPPATLTAVMSDQNDVGWSAPPIGLDLLDQGKIRILATGNDTLFKDQTVRLLITQTQTLQSRKAPSDRFSKTYSE